MEKMNAETDALITHGLNLKRKRGECKSNDRHPKTRITDNSSEQLGEITEEVRQKDPLQDLLHEELTHCAERLSIKKDQLKVWFEQKELIPDKILIHLLRIANSYALDPLQEEVFVTQYENNWHIAISVDGWIQLLQRHPAYVGITFAMGPEENNAPSWMECTIYRSDHPIPITVREYFKEVCQDSELWKKMPRRMLRHRALQQCARLAIGISLPEAPLVNQGQTRNQSITTNKASNQLTKIISPGKNRAEVLKEILSPNKIECRKFI